MKKPKILVVGSSLKDKGGIVTVIKNIEESSINDYYKIKRIETYITGSILKRLSIFIVALFKLIYSLMFFRPNVIHIHMSEKGSFYRKALILVISKLFNKPVILHIHSASFDEFYNSNEFQKKLIKFILNKADKLIVLSKQWEKYYSNIVPKDKIDVLYNGVYRIEQKFKREHTIPIGLFLGRLGERKGTYDLLSSIKRLKENGVLGKFYFAGDGEIEQVKQLISEYELEEIVTVLGWVNSTQINDLLKRVDFLVLPSYNEGLPMAILEAMNFGLPIISTYVGGIPEVITNSDNGYLIEPGEIDELTKALTSLIKSEELRLEMGEKNRAIILKRFDIQSLMKDLSNIYSRLLQN
ncbi:glycosyltransferase family 4 protein [Priestia megaterium]|uniref:glycosyltransferase family 4 protein n=1 Tax=Priestia megaterium TaxID=1404 RepID=UPI000BED06A3|nr:glycosyltransferase family 4 protein [Priestia megaterium]MBE2975906.1 glycosyltransferase family 4 protein [Priestia megaterium]PEB65255.1 glycosyl transferase [Priestia megaterium]